MSFLCSALRCWKNPQNYTEMDAFIFGVSVVHPVNAVFGSKLETRLVYLGRILKWWALGGGLRWSASTVDHSLLTFSHNTLVLWGHPAVSNIWNWSGCLTMCCIFYHSCRVCSMGFATGTGSADQVVLNAWALCHLGSAVARLSKLFYMVLYDWLSAMFSFWQWEKWKTNYFLTFKIFPGSYFYLVLGPRVLKKICLT